MVKIELEDLFRKSIIGGLNLFLGSGFSVLAKDVNLNSLPVGNMLADELISKFSLPKGLALNQISTILEATRKSDFLAYLKDRFSVSEFDSDYSALYKIKVKTVFTTNIDNLIPRIYEKNKEHYINDTTTFGPSFFDKTAIDYTPLHGSVLSDNRKLIFNTVDIASAFINESNVWQYLRISSEKSPTLFWGYSLNDSGVIQALFSTPNQIQSQKPKWIVLKNDDSASIAYFKAFGFNIVIATTKELLTWVNNLSQSESENSKILNVTSEVFSKEMVPIRSPNLPVRPIKYFYLGDIPFWSDIYSNRIPKLSHFEKALDYISSDKNLIILGIPACGKTTLMMQLAAECNFKGHKLICSNINLEKAKLIAGHLLGEPAIMFIDNFTDNVDVFEFFIKRPNIQVIAVDRQHNFEIISHRIDRNKVHIYDCTSLTNRDTQIIYDGLPADIKKNKLIRDIREASDISLFDFINLNINQPKINERYTHVLDELEKKDPLMLEFLVLTCYVNSCRTPVSFDMGSFYFKDDIASYDELYEIIDNLGQLIQEYSGNLVVDDQDYFVPRSSVISEAILEQVNSNIFKSVFQKFHNNVPKFAIARFDIFRKGAYDANKVRKAYPNWKEGKEFYEKIKFNDTSPFILQQGALYLASKRKYSDAFNWIDEALRISHKNYFTIKNTHAIILFEANVYSSDVYGSRSYLDESMEILSKCYSDDQRKSYHTTTYSRQAKQYFTIFGDKKAVEYLETAYKWLNDELVVSSWNRDIVRLIKEIAPLVANKKNS
jgi:tetratricopeptide (TPR) repeat protein